MSTWLAHATEDQKTRLRKDIAKGAKRSWQNSRKGNHRFPKNREAALYAQGCSLTHRPLGRKHNIINQRSQRFS